MREPGADSGHRAVDEKLHDAGIENSHDEEASQAASEQSSQ